MTQYAGRLLAFAFLALVARSGWAADSSAGITPRAAFERLKTLAGEWQGTMGERGGTNLATVNYRVTAAGSALVETLGSGTPYEMPTVYHLDGQKLVLTHYCAAGNQPRMALNARASSAERLVFDFAGGTNLKSTKDGHMHSLRIRFEGPNAVATEWDYWKAGKKASTEHLYFARKR